MARQPKDIEYRAEYEPDMQRMVKALRILLEYRPKKENEHGDVDFRNSSRPYQALRRQVL